MNAPAPRVLLLGASGRLGAAIARVLAQSANDGAPARDPALAWLDAPSRDALALDPARAHDAAQRWFAQWRPDLVVDCIALSDVDRCENEPLLAWQLNAALPAALARSARTAGARLIHFSTDFVFDGALRRPYREDDATNPLSVYGTSKLEGERAIAAEGCAHWIFRISWLYGSPSANLAARLLDPANAGRTIHLADDRVGVPNPVQMIATEVRACVARNPTTAPTPPPGVYHLSCHGSTTWYEFGRAFVQQAIDTRRLPADRAPRIEALDETTVARAARRPPWSALDPSRYERCFVRNLPDWKSAIALALAGSTTRDRR